MPQVGEMNIVLSLNAATYSQALDQAYKKLDALAGKSKQVGHSTVSSVQAASGALRELNGDFTNNIRAVERFITTIPGVGDALKLAFPLVGGLAFGAMLVESGKKVYEFTKALSKLPENIRVGFAELNESTHKAGVELDVTNDKLAIAIAKLEHKPANLLKLALDEDRLSAANLAGEIDRAKTSIDALLEKNSVSLFKGAVSFFTGANLDETKDTEDHIKGIVKKLQDAQYAAQDAEDAASPADAASVKLANRKKLQDALTEAIVRTSAALAKEQLADSDDTMASHAPAIGMLSGTLRQLQNQQHNFQAGNTRSDLTTKEDELTKRRELATAAREAQRAAQEEQMKVFEAGLAQLKMDHQVSTVEEDDYWRKLLAPAQKYPDNLRRVQERIGQVRQAMSREIEEMLKKLDEADKRRLEQRKQTDEKANRLADSLDRAEHKDADGNASAALARSEASDALGEMIARHDASTAAITRNDEAVKIAALHVADYAAKLKNLDDLDQADRNDGSMTAEDRQAALDGRQKQRESIRGEAARTAMSDSWAISDTSPLGEFKDALMAATDATKSYGDVLAEISGTTLSDVNKTLLEELTTRSHQRPRHLWETMGHDVATSATGALLKKGEGALLQGLGFGGKADGSSEGNALWTRIAGGAASAEHGVSSFISKLFGKSKSGSSGDSDSGDDGGGGDDGDSSFGSLASNIVPFLAGGGDFNANTMAVVGEKGPELVRFGRSGTVTSNSDLQQFGGGATHHYHIDARGASDPAQVRAAVQRGITQAAPYIVAMSVKANKETSLRKPSSMR